MEQNLETARNMLPRLSLGEADSFNTRNDLILSTHGHVRVHYAPFDYIEKRARLVVVGITPGKTQAVNAIEAAVGALKRGLPVEAALAEAKLVGSFSGALRSNLVAMLDAIGVANHFKVPSTDELFRPGSSDVHFTSALRYPVLVGGSNYNGTPDMLKTSNLRRMVETHLAEEAVILHNAIWLPLGPKAEAALRHLAKLGKLSRERILGGMPHPSGANAERVSVFLGRKPPQMASNKTNPTSLLAAFERLSGQIAALSRGVA